MDTDKLLNSRCLSIKWLLNLGTKNKLYAWPERQSLLRTACSYVPRTARRRAQILLLTLPASLGKHFIGSLGSGVQSQPQARVSGFTGCVFSQMCGTVKSESDTFTLAKQQYSCQDNVQAPHHKPEPDKILNLHELKKLQTSLKLFRHLKLFLSTIY